MLEFYYDFLHRYVDRRDFELIQMGTDSNYMAISGDKLEDIVRPELRAEFEATKKQGLAWDKWSGRTPGLLKLESEGRGMLALCYSVNGEKRSLAPKACRRNKTKLPGSDSKRRSTAVLIERKTGAFVWLEIRW